MCMTAHGTVLTRRGSIALFLILLGAFFPAGEARGSLVVNGGFELPAVGGTYSTLTSGLTGWTIESGSVDLIHTYWTPFEPTQSLDLDGTSPGTISQSFATLPGHSYELFFAFSNNPDGHGQVYNGGPSSFPASARVTLDGTTTLLSHDIWHDAAHGFTPASSLSSMNWNVYTAVFTARQHEYEVDVRVVGQRKLALGHRTRRSERDGSTRTRQPARLVTGNRYCGRHGHRAKAQ